MALPTRQRRAPRVPTQRVEHRSPTRSRAYVTERHTVGSVRLGFDRRGVWLLLVQPSAAVAASWRENSTKHRARGRQRSLLSHLHSRQLTARKRSGYCPSWIGYERGADAPMYG